MKFGVFSLLSVPDQAREAELVQGELEIDCFAEEAGFDAVWLAEHSTSHYGLICSPQVIAAAIAARTDRIRIGTAVNVLPLNHPVRIAHDFAMVDVLSGGRLNYGVGRGYSPDEFAAFGVSLQEGRERFQEALEIILKAWTQDVFSHDGRFFKIPPTRVVPKPVQQPYPPLYVAATSPETVEWAAQRLIRIISASASPENIVRKFNTYREKALAAGYCDREVEEAIADSWVMKHIYVAKDDETAIQEAGPPFLWFYKLIANRRMFDGPIEPQPLEWWMDRGACYFGSPETVARKISEWREKTGLNTVLCWMNAGGMPKDKVLNSMRLFGERVIPLFKGK